MILSTWRIGYGDHFDETKRKALPAGSFYTDHRPGTEQDGRRLFEVFQRSAHVMEEAANALASRAIASGDLRPDVDPIDLMRAIYGLSTAGSADDWPAKARKFADILLQGSRPR